MLLYFVSYLVKTAAAVRCEARLFYKYCSLRVQVPSTGEESFTSFQVFCGYDVSDAQQQQQVSRAQACKLFLTGEPYCVSAAAALARIKLWTINHPDL